MFFHSENRKVNAPNNGGDDFHQLYALGAFAVFAIVYQMVPSWGTWYLRHYVAIHMTLYGVFCIGVLFVIRMVLKRTKLLCDRTFLLDQCSDMEEGVFVGQSHDGVDIYLSEESRTGHVQIVGATGRGKTESVIVPWVCRDILAGRNVILIDGKGDPGILEPVRMACYKSRYAPEMRVLDLGNPKGSCVTNPLEFGSPQQITDRIFTAFTFEEAYYKSVQFETTSQIVQLLQRSSGYDVNFKNLYQLLTDDPALSKLVSECSDVGLKTSLTRFLAQPKSLREEKFSGLLSQIAPFAIGEVAELVNGPSYCPTSTWTVSDTLLVGHRHRPGNNYVFVILLPTLKYQQIGHQLGKLLLQELGWAVGERASRGNPDVAFTPVYLDEFSSFVYEGFTGILNKARSSRVALHLSHQSLGDLATVSPSFAEVISTNTNVKCVLGLNDPVSADFMARHLGTQTEEKLTEQAEQAVLWGGNQRTGKLSIREVEAYRVHPNRIKNFTRGGGVLHLPTPLGSITEEIQFSRLTEEKDRGFTPPYWP